MLLNVLLYVLSLTLYDFATPLEPFGQFDLAGLAYVGLWLLSVDYPSAAVCSFSLMLLDVLTCVLNLTFYSCLLALPVFGLTSLWFGHLFQVTVAFRSK